jgi:hypothetical protein
MRENSDHILHPPCTDFSLAKFSDDGCSCQFSSPCCGAQFTSHDAEVIPNQRINLVFSLSLLWLIGHCRACDQCLFPALKTMDPASNWANIYGILTIYASQQSKNHYWTGAFCSKKFNHHSLPRMYIHIWHFVLLLWWQHMYGAPMILV